MGRVLALRKVCAALVRKNVGADGWTEFNDLWHALTVPNDVDLLRQLENGTFLPLISQPIDLHLYHPLFSTQTLAFTRQLVIYRGTTSRRIRSAHDQGAPRQEEEEVRAAPAPGQDYEHAFEGYWDRSHEGLCGAWQVDCASGHLIDYMLRYLKLSEYVLQPFPDLRRVIGKCE